MFYGRYSKYFSLDVPSNLKEKHVVQDVAKEEMPQRVKEKKQQVEKNLHSVVADVAKKQKPQPVPAQEGKQQVENKLDPVNEDLKGQTLKELISANYAPSEDSSTAGNFVTSLPFPHLFILCWSVFKVC